MAAGLELTEIDGVGSVSGSGIAEKVDRRHLFSGDIGQNKVRGVRHRLT